MKHQPPLGGLRVLVPAMLFAALTSCVPATKYKMAKDDVPPATPLGWSASSSSARLKLDTLIVPEGPGSWKRVARWDEYVVTVSNRSGRPLVIESAHLVDVLGDAQATGDEPWSLEKRSKANLGTYKDAGVSAVMTAGGAVLFGVAASAASTATLTGVQTAAIGTAGMVAIPVVAAIDITAVAIIDHNRKDKIEAEFDRRRLKLPQTLGAGSKVSGSLFFPTTPGPKRLILRLRSGGRSQTVSLELKPLSGLHLEAAERG